MRDEQPWLHWVNCQTLKHRVQGENLESTEKPIHRRDAEDADKNQNAPDLTLQSGGKPPHSKKS
jgi:hypothetical protein